MNSEIKENANRKAWYINGKFHREDGPAVIYADGSKYWYIDGIELDIGDFIDRITDQALLEEIVFNHLPGFKGESV